MKPSNRNHQSAGLFAFLPVGAFALMALWSCSVPVTQATVYADSIFRITATSPYSGELVSDSSTKAVSGTGSQDITVTAQSGQQYTLTLTKTTNDGTLLTIELITNETVDGVPTSVVVQTDTTNDPNVPARVTLLE